MQGCDGGRAERGGGSHRELDDATRLLDGLNAVTTRRLLADVTCDRALCEANAAGGGAGLRRGHGGVAAALLDPSGGSRPPPC
jgi:hypothetical protein